MVLLEKAIYEETKRIVLGKSTRSPILVDLSDWFLATFSVKVLNFEFSKLKYPGAKRYRLLLIIQTTEGYKEMYVGPVKPKEEYQQQIADEFCKLALKYAFASEAQLENLFVTFNDFSEEAKTEANWKAAKEVKEFVKKKYPVAWDVLAMFSSSVVFYFSDSDIASNENNGTSKAIANDYYSILKKYDELNYFTRENISLKFDSKENLDKNYAGSFYYYTR
jgi:hypothetical protein